MAMPMSELIANVKEILRTYPQNEVARIVRMIHTVERIDRILKFDEISDETKFNMISSEVRLVLL